MAKSFLPAALPARDTDVPLSDEQLLRLSLLERLRDTRREALLRYPNAMVLRWFGPNEEICRQGAEDCTAFFVLHEVDWLRVSDTLQRIIADPEIDPEIAEAAQGSLQRLEEAINQLTPARREQLMAAHVAAEEVYQKQQEAAAAQTNFKKLRLSMDEEIKQHLKEMEATDKPKATALKALLTQNAAKQREEAAKLTASHPALADLLQVHAEAGEQEAAAKKAAEDLWKQYLPASARACADPDQFADVHLRLPEKQAKVSSGSWWHWLRGLGRSSSADNLPTYFPSDGPREIDCRTRHATINEGEVFGEMACLTRRPRSATVKALRGGLVLEMLSNILAVIDEDPAYKAERDEQYRSRVLDHHLRDLSIFSKLTEEQFAQVFAVLRPQVELVSYTSGQVIMDEHDRSDCMYLVRDGIVQVKKNVTALLRLEDVTSWPQLKAAARSADGPFAALLRRMPEEARTLLSGPIEPGALTEAQRREIVYSLNDILKGPDAGDVAECKDIIASPLFQMRASALPATAKERSELEQRHFNRLLMEHCLPSGTLRLFQKAAGPERIIAYLSRGEIIGEMGLMKGLPRSATCLALGQPRKSNYSEDQNRLIFRHKEYKPTEIDFGLPEGAEDAKAAARVEMVRLPAKLFWQLVEQFPFLKQQIAQVISSREASDQKALSRGLSAEPRGDLTSAEASRLGLIQGQQLMLIDLERCTRCNECVQACVDAHPQDGHSRLFLFGPRFGKYLVPTTCRSCLDPVCMIGCPVRAIQRGDNHEMQIKDWCIGCTKCAKQCPYDSIQMHPLDADEKGEVEGDVVDVNTRAVTCDLCSSTPSGEPSCVYACPHEAAFRVNAQSDLPSGLEK